MSVQNILIVEDSRLINQAINERLSALGLNCFSAFTLQSAYEIYDKESIDLIILDLHLPDGEGEDFILDLRAKNPHTKDKFVVFTSSNDLSRRDELFRLGIVDYLSKGKHADLIIHDLHTIINNLNKNEHFSILIVDDSSVVRLMMSSLLEPQGYTIVQAKNVDEAQKILNDKRNIDLILLDLEMHGIGGKEFLEMLKSDEKFLDTPVLVVSSHSEINIIRDIYKLGAAEFFKKPFAPEEFLLKVQHHINHKEALIKQEQLHNSYKEFKKSIVRDTIYASFKKNGKIEEFSEAFKNYFQESSLNIQKLFAPFFEPSIINNIINAIRSSKSYTDHIQDLHGREFIIRCFPTLLENHEERFHLILIAV